MVHRTFLEHAPTSPSANDTSGLYQLSYNLFLRQHEDSRSEWGKWFDWLNKAWEILRRVGVNTLIQHQSPALMSQPKVSRWSHSFTALLSPAVSEVAAPAFLLDPTPWSIRWRMLFARNPFFFFAILLDIALEVLFLCKLPFSWEGMWIDGEHLECLTYIKARQLMRIPYFGFSFSTFTCCNTRFFMFHSQANHFALLHSPSALSCKVLSFLSLSAVFE